MKEIEEGKPGLQQPDHEVRAYPPSQRLETEMKALREMVMQNNKMLHSIRRQMRLASIWGMLRLLILIVPLILAAIYLPPYIREAIDYYRNFSEASSGFNGVGNLDLTELQNLLQSTGLLER